MGMILGHTSPTNGAITAPFRGEQSGIAILFRVARPSNRPVSLIVPAGDGRNAMQSRLL
ncbi:hypothetical protein [Azospirillum humicireducens]|uniref:hypothetical protein n=1 Tax=Azospirillum humicireducens TaxID=1226968 RepID=UPI000A9D4F0E|nr:hypothetical protein [Azospirillum humicireducens]